MFQFNRRLRAKRIHRQTVFSSIPSLALPDRLSKITYKGYSRPLSLKVEPTDICNNDCIICAYSAQTREHRTMSLDLFKKVVSDYEEIGGGVFAIAELVGDILLDKYLPERIEIVKGNKAISKLITTTNGVSTAQYDNDTLQFIVQSFDRFRISIYGLDAEEHKAITRRDDYDKALDSISRILRYSTGNVQFLFRLLKSYSDEKVSQWIADIKARSNYQGHIKVGDVRNQYSNWSILDINSKLPFDAKFVPLAKIAETCLTPLVAPAVTANGDVSFCACADFDVKLLLGNINNSSLREIYNGENCKRFYNWKKYGVPDFCKTCTFYVPMRAIKRQPAYFSGDIFN